MLKITNIFTILMIFFFTVDFYFTFFKKNETEMNEKKVMLFSFFRLMSWCVGALSAWFLYFEFPPTSIFMQIILIIMLFYFLILRIVFFRGFL